MDTAYQKCNSCGLCPAQKTTALPRNHGTVALYQRAFQTSLNIIIKTDRWMWGGGANDSRTGLYMCLITQVMIFMALSVRLIRV